MITEKEGKIPGPPPSTNESHIAKNRFPNVRPNVGAMIFIEALAWATVQAPYPEGFFNAEMVFKFLLVFHTNAG